MITWSPDERLSPYTFRICDCCNADFVRNYVTADAYPIEVAPLRRLKALQYMRDRGLTADVWRVLAQCRREYTASVKRYRAASVDRGLGGEWDWVVVRHEKNVQSETLRRAEDAYNQMFWGDEWRAKHRNPEPHQLPLFEALPDER